MPDTVRLRAALQALFPDNLTKSISAQDLRDLLASALLEIIEYPASSVGGIRIRPAAGADTSDILRLGRYGATGALIGLGVGNQAHIAFFRDNFVTELWHLDLSDGSGKGVSLGLDWMAGNHTFRVAFPSSLSNPIYGGRPALQIGGPQRSSDPSLDNDSGTSTGLNTIGVLNDTTKFWADGQWAGFIVEIYGGTGAGQMRLVDNNTLNQLQLPTGERWAIVPDATSLYRVYQVREGDEWYDNVAKKKKFFDGTAIRTITST